MNDMTEINSQDNKGNIHFKFEVGQKLTAIILALSIAVNIWAAWEFSRFRVEEELKIFLLNDFKSHEFSDLKSKVDTNNQLVQAYGLSKECRK